VEVAVLATPFEVVAVVVLAMAVGKKEWRQCAMLAR
jgi:hypothetical protein